jgi:hypothetical protein
MDDHKFVKILMEKQGILLDTNRAQFMTGPNGLVSLLSTIRSEIFKKDVSGFTPNDYLDFRR